MAAETDLLFHAPLGDGRSPVDLVFGDDEPAEQTVVLHAAGRISGLRGAIALRTLVLASAHGQITGLRGSARGQININVARPAVGQVPSAWQEASAARAVLRSAYQQAAPVLAAVQERGEAAVPISALLWQTWQQGQRLAHATQAAWQDGERVARTLRQAYEEATRTRAASRQAWQEAQRVGMVSRQQFEETLRRRHSVAQSFGTGVLRGAAVRTDMQDGRAVRIAVLGRYEEAWHPRPGITPPGPKPPIDPPCYVPAIGGPVDLVFVEPWHTGSDLVFICCRETAPPGATITVPRRKVYIVLNSITLHRVDTGAELHAHSFSMSLDYQSWTWQWSASLHHDAASHLGRKVNGDPAELAVEVNGVPFRLRLERIGKDRRFLPQQRWSVSGKGKASILAAPWAPELSFGNAAGARTAQQLALEALSINGAGIGWSIDWQLQDWLVPAGAWTFRGQYIDAINDIAGAAGGYVQPHPTDAVLRILPRYPSAPWAWADVTPDFEIPADVAEVEGTEYLDKPAYNRVFVGGIGSGVFGPITRAGTAGDVIAPQVTHALITDATAHRQRGLAELADAGRQELVKLNMQVLPETGVIVPGKFIRYLGEQTVMGIVRGVSIDWAAPKLRQTLEIETHA